MATKRSTANMNPQLVIDLRQMFGQRIPDSESFRQAVGQDIIEAIRERTLGGVDRNGRSFDGYSKEYKKSIEFLAAGKSEVNLRLTGEMLGFMDVLSTDVETITIGFNDDFARKKAHGHILGSDPGPKVKRDFFGISNDELNDIASRYTIPSEPEEEQSSVLQTLIAFGALFRG